MWQLLTVVCTCSLYYGIIVLTWLMIFVAKRSNFNNPRHVNYFHLIIKAIHVGPISTMDFDCTSTLLATGSSDSTIKVWDIEKQYCTHNLKGHTGVVRWVELCVCEIENNEPTPWYCKSVYLFAILICALRRITIIHFSWGLQGASSN